LSVFVHILTFVGTPALALALARSFVNAACGVMILVAGIAAIRAKDDEHRKACLQVMEKVTRESGGLLARLLGRDDSGG
jgi:hypothetical protein